MKTSIKHFPVLLFLLIFNYNDLRGQNLNLLTFKGTYDTDIFPDKDKNGEFLRYHLYFTGNQVLVRKIIYKVKEYNKKWVEKFPKSKATLENTFERLSDDVEFDCLMAPSDKLGSDYVLIDIKTKGKVMNISIFDNYLTVNNSYVQKLEENVKLYQTLTYYDNGKRRTSGGYEKGKREGDWTFFDENENRSLVRFKNGVEISRYKVSEKGEIIK